MTSSLPADLRIWFAGRARPLPWRIADTRGLRDPYRTWIAEIMLQQTRVEAVIPYFENFMREFAGPASLAAASEEQVLKAWAGLGYYRRARMLHAASASLVRDHGGVFPSNAAALQSLPGIGAYTAAAIASLAFGERIPVVDGNVKRVVARWSGLELAADDPKLEQAARVQGQMWMDRLPQGELVAAGQLNEALMELGATLCLQRHPLCEQCPLAASCVAKGAERAMELPLPKRLKKWVDLEMVYLVQRVGARVLLRTRSSGWSPGLYEPPSIICKAQTPLQALASLLAGGLLSCGLRDLESIHPHGVVRHTITHHRIRAHIFSASAATSDLGEDWHEPAAVPLTGLARKVLQQSSL